MLAFRLAMRFFREGRTQTVLIAAGVTIGIAAYVFVSSLMQGLAASLIERTLGTQAHIVVEPDDSELTPLMSEDALYTRRFENSEPQQRPFDQWQQAQRRIESDPAVIAVCPKVSGSVVVRRGSNQEGAVLIGADATRLRRIVDFPANMVAGHYRLGSDDALIGEGMADAFGLGVGDPLRVVRDDREAILRVAGIFSLGNAGADDSWVVASLGRAQSVLSREGDITAIDVRVRELFDAETVAARLSLRTGCDAESWMERNQQLLIALNSQEQSSLMIRLFVLLAVAMGIASVLVVSVVQKQGQIGILRAVGTSRRTVQGIFLWQGAILGLFGAFFGILAGAFFAGVLDDIVLFEMTVDLELIAVACTISVVTGLVSAALPARRAARMDPAAAIRGDA